MIMMVEFRTLKGRKAKRLGLQESKQEKKGSLQQVEAKSVDPEGI